MEVNKANFGIGVKWDKDTTVNSQKITDWTELPKPANVDKMVLVFPVTDTRYTRNEFYRHKPDDDSVGQCVTYSERTVTFADGSSWTGSHTDYSFAIKIGQFARPFGKSGVDENEIESAVEETWIYKERSLDNTTLSAGVSGQLTNGNVTISGEFGITAQNTEYRYAAAGQTAGTVNYKDGAIKKYVQNAAQAQITNKTDISASAGVSVSVKAADAPTEKKLTDRDIFIIFTGREPMKTAGTPFEGKNAAGSEDWFDEDGNFIHKDDEELIARYKKFYELTVFSGIPLNKQSPNNVADFFGNVGKRIDEAYASGKCTAEQKEQLDKMLSDTALEFSERAQRRQAMFKISREEFNLPIKERMALLESRKEMSPEDRMAEMKAKIDKYVDKYFKVDRDTLFNMINAVRYSRLNVLSLLPKA